MKISVVDFFRETGELTLQIPALPRPTLKELRRDFSWIKSIERDTSPTEAVTLKLGTVLRPSESRVSGAERECRIAESFSSLTDFLGYQQLKWLADNQDEQHAFKALVGKIFIEGPGIIVLHAEDGRRKLPFLNGSERWRLDPNWEWIEHVFHRDGRLAVASR